MYWETHGASPGEPTDWDDLEAIRIANMVETFGWDMVKTLYPLRLTAERGEALLTKLYWLKDWQRAQQRQQQEQEMR